MLCVEMLFMSWYYCLSFAWAYQTPLPAETRILIIVGMLTVGFGIPALLRIPRADILKTASDCLIDGGALMITLSGLALIADAIISFELSRGLAISVSLSGLIMIALGDIIASINHDTPIHVRLVREIGRILLRRLQRYA